MKSSISRWIAGISATIIGGFILWWLTLPGGKLNPIPPPKPVKDPVVSIKLLESKFDSPNLDRTKFPYGDRLKATFVVYNEGDATAENCVVWLVDGGSVKFGLTPGMKRSVRTLTSQLYRNHGTYTIVGWIACDDYKRTLYSQKHSW